MSSPPRNQPPSAKHDESLADGQEEADTAPSDPSVKSPATDQDKILAEKQERVRRVLWHCLKSPPQVEVKVGPGELRVAAKFNTGDVGVLFEDVKTEDGQIIVAAQLDPSTVEVNFEQLSALAGLDNTEEAVYIWEAIKEQVGTVSPALDIEGSVEDKENIISRNEVSPDLDQGTRDKVSPKGGDVTIARQDDGRSMVHTPPPDTCAQKSQPPSATTSALATANDLAIGAQQPSVQEQLFNAASDIQRCALKAQVKKCEVKRETALQENGSSSKGIEHRIKEIDTASRKIDNAVELANTTTNAINLREVVIWYVDFLFGDKGLDNLHQCLNSVNQDQGVDVYEPPRNDDGAPSALMDDIASSYQKLVENSKVRGDAYQERLLEFIHFCNRQQTFWERCFVHESPERQAVLAYWHKDGRSTYVDGVGWKAKPGNQIGVLLRQWIEKTTGHRWTTIQNEIWIGRHLKGMVRMFGHGVLCFMDTDLEDRLRRLRSGRGIFVCFTKAIETMFGKDLRDICEKCRLAMSSGSLQPDAMLEEVRAQLLSLSDVPSDNATSSINILLADIEAGRVELNMYGDAGNDEPANSGMDAAQSPTTKREKGNRKLGKDAASTPKKTTSSDRGGSKRSVDANGPANETGATKITPVSKSGTKKRNAGNHAEYGNVGSPKKKIKETPKPKTKLVVTRKPTANDRS